jgi:Ras-related protein Rab-1A
MQKEQQEEIKLLLLGESSVGKTSIFNRYIYDKMDKNVSSSIGVDFETKTIKYRNKKYKIRLFDTAGQERFQSITHSYYHMGDGFLIVFDLTNEHSLNMVKEWIESLQENVEDCKFLIIGNKCDLIDKFIPDDVINTKLQDYNKDKKLLYKTSALKNINISEVIEIMIDYIEDPTSIIKKVQINNSFHLKHKKEIDPQIDKENKRKEQCC